MFKILVILCVTAVVSHSELECQERFVKSPCVEASLSSCVSVSTNGIPTGCNDLVVKTKGNCTEYFGCVASLGP